LEVVMSVRVRIVLLLALLTIPYRFTAAQEINYVDKIEGLLDQLRPHASGGFFGKHWWTGNVYYNSISMGPYTTLEEKVETQLETIARVSPEGRYYVIRALVLLLDDPAELAEGQFNGGFVAARWNVAVRVLGELKATEAIDVLARSLDQTGQFGRILPVRERPVSGALEKIGESAVPRLIEALSDQRAYVGFYAAGALAQIGAPAQAKLREALTSNDADTKCGAALALAWIGGDDAEAAIQAAIATEAEAATQSKLKEALGTLKYYRTK
jgi:HEAT repeat protein